MKRTIEIETSQFSDSSTKHWGYGIDVWFEDVVVEFPNNFDYMSDDEILEKCDNEEEGFYYVSDI